MQQSNSVDLSVSVVPDSLGLLPGTVAVFDCGDRIIVRKNILRGLQSEDSSSLQGSSAAAGKLALEVGDMLDGASHALVKRLEQQALAAAAARFPVPVVFVLPRPGTPQDRMLYCRLAPTHTDARESIHNSMINTSEVPHLLAVSGDESSAVAVHERDAKWRKITQGLTAQDLDALVMQLPYTDQAYFAKYLVAIAPTQAAKLLSKLTLPVEELRRAAPVSMNMDRGPPVVVATASQSYYSVNRVPQGGDDGSLLPL